MENPHFYRQTKNTPQSSSKRDNVWARLKTTFSQVEKLAHPICKSPNAKHYGFQLVLSQIVKSGDTLYHGTQCSVYFFQRVKSFASDVHEDVATVQCFTNGHSIQSELPRTLEFFDL